MSNGEFTSFTSSTEKHNEDMKQIVTIRSRIETISEEVTEANQKFNTILQEVNQLNEILQYFSTECIKKYSGLNIYQSLYQDHAAGYRNLFKQLENLSFVYTNFIVAYDQMLGEIERRKRVQEKQKQIVNDLQNKLNEFRDRELQDRNNFLETWGKYLPSNMSPGLWTVCNLV